MARRAFLISLSLSSFMSPLEKPGVCAVCCQEKTIKPCLTKRWSKLTFATQWMIRVRTEGVEDATGVADFVGGDRVAGEKGILVHGAGLDPVPPAADLDVVHHQELSGNEAEDVEGELDLGQT
eukprot:8076910-Pyramimonas_sp.AAC.2